MTIGEAVRRKKSWRRFFTLRGKGIDRFILKKAMKIKGKKVRGSMPYWRVLNRRVLLSKVGEGNWERPKEGFQKRAFIPRSRDNCSWGRANSAILQNLQLM